jgi:hypothetical protein
MADSDFICLSFNNDGSVASGLQPETDHTVTVSSMLIKIRNEAALVGPMVEYCTWQKSNLPGLRVLLSQDCIESSAEKSNDDATAIQCGFLSIRIEERTDHFLLPL